MADKGMQTRGSELRGTSRLAAPMGSRLTDRLRWQLATDLPPGALRLPLLGGRPLTPARAVRLIAILTFLLTIASGVAMRLVDGREFPTIGIGLWWAAQTVTTVGYGDVVPHETAGRIVALVVMFDAVGFMAVIAGAVTATLIEGARGRRGLVPLAPVPEQLDEINDRLKRLEAALLARSAVAADVAHDKS